MLFRSAVAEIVTGIILGKSLLDTIKITSSVSLLSNLGVILLMFLSGMEINFDLFKKKDLPESKQSKINPARIAIMAFTAITITAFALAYILKLRCSHGVPLSRNPGGGRWWRCFSWACRS